ncbi:hypothetical protein RRG08_037992 [Elysia crispata]|uniref:Uncharacterized protein n=1 Tax=Elysia crispata TaxID=231223 RepID=A0AAE1DWK8_9GAST|nr:hypothetical protein RRG08_037992 [Elysia crispata]
MIDIKIGNQIFMKASDQSPVCTTADLFTPRGSGDHSEVDQITEGMLEESSTDRPNLSQVRNDDSFDFEVRKRRKSALTPGPVHSRRAVVPLLSYPPTPALPDFTSRQQPLSEHLVMDTRRANSSQARRVIKTHLLEPESSPRFQTFDPLTAIQSY